MKKMFTWMNKIILGAGIVGTLYMNSCAKIEKTPRDNHNKNSKEHSVAIRDGIVTIETNPNTGVLSAYTGLSKDSCGCNEYEHIQLNPIKMTWSNTKLIGKDEGFVSYRLGDSGYDYTYGEYLFKNPQDEEVTLFGKEGTFFVGQNYNIEFYLLKPNQKVSGNMVLDAFRIVRDGKSVYVNNSALDKDLDGLLTNYSMVKKTEERPQ